MNRFIDALEKGRKMLGLNKSQYAEKGGVSKGTYGNWIAGKGMTEDSFRAFCQNVGLEFEIVVFPKKIK